MHMFGLVRSNVALILPIFSAASSFALNLLLKANLEPAAYGTFALSFFIVSTLASIGIVGYDQIVMKMSKLRDSSLELDRNTIFFGCVIFFASPFIIFALLNSFGVINELSWWYVSISLIANAISVISIIYGLQGKLLECYLYSGSWKILSFIIFSISLIVGYDVSNFYFVFLISLALTFFWVLVFGFKICKVTNNAIKFRSLSALYLASLFSIASYMSFEGLDRFIINSNFNAALFGEYFFFFNFFVAPLSVFATYFANKRLIAYKTKIEFGEVVKDYFRVMFLCFIVSVSLLILIHCAVASGNFSLGSINFETLAIIAVLCLIRNCYIILSNAYKTVARSITLYLVGFIFFICAIFMYKYFTYFFTKADLNVAILVVTTIWLVRTLLYIYVIKVDIAKST